VLKIKEIAEAMVGNTVWCCNKWFAPSTTPCAEVVGCTFKDRQVRLATPRELYKCRMFQITTISSSWETAAHVILKPKESRTVFVAKAVEAALRRREAKSQKSKKAPEDHSRQWQKR